MVIIATRIRAAHIPVTAIAEGISGSWNVSACLLLKVEVLVPLPEVIKDLLLPLSQHLLQALASLLSLIVIILYGLGHHAAGILTKLVESIHELLDSSVLSIRDPCLSVNNRAGFTSPPSELFPGIFEILLAVDHSLGLGLQVLPASTDKSGLNLAKESFWVLIERVSDVLKTLSKSFNAIDEVESLVG